MLATQRQGLQETPVSLLCKLRPGICTRCYGAAHRQREGSAVVGAREMQEGTHSSAVGWAHGGPWMKEGFLEGECWLTLRAQVKRPSREGHKACWQQWGAVRAPWGDGSGNVRKGRKPKRWLGSGSPSHALQPILGRRGPEVFKKKSDITRVTSGRAPWVAVRT